MKLYKFEATPTILPNGTVTWKLCYIESATSYPKCGTTKADFPDVTVPMGAHQNQPFQFNILGDTGITFAPNPAPQQKPTSANPGPIWINPEGTPNGPGVHSEFEFAAGGGPTKLVLNDKNNDAGTYKYQLNFVDSTGKAVTALDPEITNGGKGLYSFTATELAIGVAVLLAVGYFLRPLFRAIFGR